MISKTFSIPYKHDFSSNQSRIKSNSDFGLSFKVNGPFLNIKNGAKKVNDYVSKNIKREVRTHGLSLDALEYKIFSNGVNVSSKTKKYSVLLSSKKNNLEYVMDFSTYGNKLKLIGAYKVF